MQRKKGDEPSFSSKGRRLTKLNQICLFRTQFLVALTLLLTLGLQPLTHNV
jgi:hypothetical protein